MSIVKDLKDEYQAIATARLPWERHWRAIATYVLPQTEEFSTQLNGSPATAINSVTSTPVASEKSKDLYDMTSLWAIERLSAGILSLKTPETESWHNIGVDIYFGEDTTHDEDLALERLRNYLFRVRANPNSGFWGSHRAAIKSMCAFGDGWQFIEELHGSGRKRPYGFEFVPLPQCYPMVDARGKPDRMYRPLRWSAYQAVKQLGAEKCPTKVVEMANDVKRRHMLTTVMHAVLPRDDGDRAGRMGVKGAAFQSHYIFPDDNHHCGESGFYEFPFIRYAWSNSGNRPFSEGPIAYALGELKSLQEMAKNELIASATALRPAFATAGKNFVKMNFNPGANNPGLVTPEGKPLFHALNTGTRPDFAQAVLAARRDSVREMLYLNLWQIILQDKNDTATAALIKAQEKGEMLGPVGLSLNEGLSNMVEREVGILGRKGAFDNESPLAMPDTLAGRDVTPVFNSPLDRLRRMGELVGMQRMIEFAMLMAGGDAGRAATIMARFNIDEMLDAAREVLGAPVNMLDGKEQADEVRGQQNQMSQMMQALAAMKGGGEAAKAVGEGAGAMALGTEQAVAAPALKSMIGGAQGAAAGMMQQ